MLMLFLLLLSLLIVTIAAVSEYGTPPTRRFHLYVALIDLSATLY